MAAGHTGRAFRLASAGAALAPQDQDLAEVYALSAWHTGRRADARRVALAQLLESLAAGRHADQGADGVAGCPRRLRVGRHGRDTTPRVATLIDLLDVDDRDDDRADLLARIAEITMLTSRLDAVDWAERAVGSNAAGHACARGRA